MRPYRLIQAGMGGMGRAWWTGAVRYSPDFELVAIVDIADHPLHQAGDELGIPRQWRFNSLESALDSVPADAVLTVTPPAVHVEHARLCFSRGLHLLSEKPIANHMAGARLMVDLARQANRQLVIAQNYRYSAPAQKLKQLFDEKPLGPFGHGHIDFYIPADFPDTFRQIMEFPLLVDMAIHHLDLVRFITGQNIAQVTAQSFQPHWSWFKHDAALKMLLQLDDGTPFSYSGDWTARGKPTTWNGTWRLQFEQGSIHLEDDKIVITRSDKWSKNVSHEPIEIPPVDRNGQGALLGRFATAIRENQPAATSGADNLWSFAAVMAGVKSARESRTVQVLIPSPGTPGEG